MIRLIFNKWLIIGLLILLSMKMFAAEEYEFDKVHTFVIWRVSHFGFSDVTGKFLAYGTLKVDKDRIQNSTLSVTVPMSSSSSGIKRLDDKLKLKSYFDFEKYPNATFISKRIKKTGKDTGVVEGNLTIKDITKPVSLKMTLVKEGKHPIYNRNAMGFRATATVNRSDFGMRAYIPGVSDKVEIEIQAEAILKAPPDEEAAKNAD